jgi:single-strand DNA-binding protein
MSINSIVLAGKIMSSVERHYLPDGTTPIVTFKLSFEVYTGKETVRSAIIQVTAFGNNAALVTEAYSLGAQAIVEGVLNVRAVETPSGKRNEYSIDLRRIHAGAINLNLNQVSFVGRLGNDPEAKYFASGAVKTNISVAVNAIKKGVTNWFSVELWGKTGDVAANYTRKGSQVGIIGVLHVDFWTDKQSGEERSRFLIKGDRLELIGSKRDNDEEGASAPARQPVAAGRAPAPVADLDDIPF